MGRNLKPTSTYIGDGEEKLKEIIESHEGNTVQISHTVNQVSEILDAVDQEATVEPVEPAEPTDSIAASAEMKLILKKKQQTLKLKNKNRSVTNMTSEQETVEVLRSLRY